MILNNLNSEKIQFDSNFPYHKEGKRWQVDLCIANESALEKVTNFGIHQLPTIFQIIAQFQRV